MTAIDSMDTGIKLASGGGVAAPQPIHFFKDSRIAGAAAGAMVAGRINSAWQYGGAGWGPGLTPGAVRIPTRATPGALGQANPTNGRQLFLAGGIAWATQIGTLMLCDRLLDVSGFSGIVTTPQSVQGAGNTPALTRYANGIGNQVGAEIYTLIGASGTTITYGYTDESGNTGNTSEASAIGNTGLREVQRFLPLPVGAGDRGVQSVKDATLLATTGTVGDWGITIYHSIIEIPIPIAGVASIADVVTTLPALPEILTDAALYWMFLSNGTVVPQFGGFLELLEN